MKQLTVILIGTMSNTAFSSVNHIKAKVFSSRFWSDRSFWNVFFLSGIKRVICSSLRYFQNSDFSQYQFSSRLLILIAHVYWTYLANIYLFKVSNRNTRKRCEIHIQSWQKYQNDVVDVVLVFWFMTLNIFHTFF